MPYNPQIHHRRSIRLKGYDYSQSGLYFITTCCQDRACLFGEIVGGSVGASLVGDLNNINDNHENGRPQGYAPTNPQMILNDAGRMVETEWLKLTDRFPNIELHEYVVMPNHFHGILEIVPPDETIPKRVGTPLVGVQNDKNGNPNDDIGNGEKGGHKGTPQRDTQTEVSKNKTIGDMMDAFKSITTVEYIRGVKTLGWKPFNGKLWQRNYYEHIIRNEQSCRTISEYIIANPSKWANDKFYR